jgi:hypothetical protein
MRFALLMLALPVLLATEPARALEPFKLYDRFSDKPIDPARWQPQERVRVIKGGAMQLMQRNWSLPTSDFGVFLWNWQTDIPLSMTHSITAMKARITVTELETVACPTNPAIGDARARIFGTFFNTGTPTPGSLLGDAIAQVRLFRASNSPEPAGVLLVQGLLSVCNNADCSNATTVGMADLGTVAVGKAATVGMQWDQPGKTFYFSRDGAATQSVTYTQSDAMPPGIEARNLSTRMNVPNCRSAPPVAGVIDAKFDNVSLNESAVPR